MTPRLLLAAAIALVLPVTACAEREEAGSPEPTVSETTPRDTDAAAPTTPTDTGAPALQQSGPVPVTGSAGVEQAVVVSGSEVGGEVSPLAFPLESPQERRDFGAQFDRGFGREVAQAAQSLDAPADSTTWGTVAAVGCAGPRSVRIDAGEAGFEVTPRLPESTVQCLVPVTYVVVFAAPPAS